MSSAKKQATRFRVGDWVSYDYGSTKGLAKVIEDRGPLGVRGSRLYRIQPDEQRESSAFEMPEDELAAAPPPVRQSYDIRYHRLGHTNDWRARTNVGEVYRGVKSKGAVGYSTGFWQGESQEELKSASVSVLLEVDARYGEPGLVVPPEVEHDMVELARSLADEMFLSRHPRAKITHFS
jgi:hypothetical protein